MNDSLYFGLFSEAIPNDSVVTVADVAVIVASLIRFSSCNTNGSHNRTPPFCTPEK